MNHRTLSRSLVLLSASAGVLLATAAPAAADVNGFDFSSWDAVFEVGVDADGRATLHVEETRVAEFPDFDQNRGIVAGYPERYQDAGLDTRILSVTDENGSPVEYETETDDGMLYVLTGDDDYVHGTTTYVIEYEMRDVVLAAEGTGVDEFYWDLLPQDSTQDIGAFHAEIRFDDALAAALTGASDCYRGRVGSTDRCDLVGDDGVYTVDAAGLAAGDGITVAIAMDSGTVVQPPARLPNAATDVAPYGVGALALLLSIGAWIASAFSRRAARRSGGLVVAQYDVPDAMPPLLASAIVPKPKNVITAQIIHLAVRGMLRLEELPETDAQKKELPRLRRLDAPIPDPIDEKALTALLGAAGVGSLITMPRASESFANRMRALQASAPDEAVSRGLLRRARSLSARILQTLAILVLVAMIGLLAWGAVTGRSSVAPVLAATGLVGAVVLFGIGRTFGTHLALTRDGALQLDHLDGVREFIRVAEADRLRMLQSYSGAERRSDGSVDVIHVYERLLPYAILFGLEKEWGEVLELAYSRSGGEVGWVDGSTTGIAARIVYFNSATRSASTYTAPSTGTGSGSSSFGGSSGGGFSGGGGGGGFSGGR